MGAPSAADFSADLELGWVDIRMFQAAAKAVQNDQHSEFALAIDY
jgi:hypothetical protein